MRTIYSQCEHDFVIHTKLWQSNTKLLYSYPPTLCYPNPLGKKKFQFSSKFWANSWPGAWPEGSWRVKCHQEQPRGVCSTYYPSTKMYQLTHTHNCTHWIFWHLSLELQATRNYIYRRFIKCEISIFADILNELRRVPNELWWRARTGNQM